MLGDKLVLVYELERGKQACELGLDDMVLVCEWGQGDTELACV